MYIVHPASFTLNSVLQGTWKLPYGLQIVLLCLFKKTTQPEVTSIVFLAEMIKFKPPGKVRCHQNRIFFPSKD